MMGKRRLACIFVMILWVSSLSFGGGQVRQFKKGVPDLTVQFKPATGGLSIVVGQDISNLVTPTVSNLGRAPVTGYSIDVYLASASSASVKTLIGRKRKLPTLAPRASQTVPISPVRIPDNISYGDYVLSVVVDPEDAINESDETNNKASVGFPVLADAGLIEQYYIPTAAYLHFNGKGFGTWKSSMVARMGPYSIATSPQSWSNQDVRAYPDPKQIPVGAQIYQVALYDGTKPICKPLNKRWGVFLNSVNPVSGPPGTTVHVLCVNAQSQGTKKLCLFKENGQLAAEVPVSSWNNSQIVGIVPDIPPGTYCFQITDGGQDITPEWKVMFTIP